MVTKVQTVDNLHYANINGYEIELNYRPDANNLVHLGYAYNHTNVGRITHNDIENIRSSVPKDVFNILVSHTFDNNLWASIAFYYTSSMEYLDSGNPQGPLRRLDINTGKSFNLSEVVPLIRTTCLGVIFPVNHAAINGMVVS